MFRLSQVEMVGVHHVTIAYREERSPYEFRLEGFREISAEQMADIEILFGCKAEAGVVTSANNGVRSAPHLVVWLIGATVEGVTEAIKKLREVTQ